MITLIAYDISDDRNRTRAANLLKDYGDRVQYSVFECDLRQSDIKVLTRKLRPMLDPATDTLTMYRLCRGCIQRILPIAGKQPDRQTRFNVI